MKRLKLQFSVVRTCYVFVFWLGSPQTLQAQTAQGQLTSSLAKVAMAPAIVDAVQYVSQEGSDSSNGLSWGTAVADIITAYNHLLSCTIPALNVHQTFRHCGVISIGAGTYTISSTIDFTSPMLTVRGAGRGVTILQSALSTGCVIDWTSDPFNSGQASTKGGGLFDLTILGTSTPSTCGVKTHDITGWESNVAIQGFVGPGGIGWWNEAIELFNERFSIPGMEIANNTTDVLFQNANPSSLATFGYGNLTLWLNADAGQTAMALEGYSPSAGLLLDNEVVSIHINLGSTGTCGTLTNAAIMQVQGVVHCEQSGGSGQTGFTTDSTSYLQVSGDYFSLGPDSTTHGNPTNITTTQLLSGASYTSWELYGGSRAIIGAQNPGTATGSTNLDSPSLDLTGKCFHASASQPRAWLFQDVESSGTDANSALVINPSSVCGGNVNVELGPGVGLRFQPSSGRGNLSFGLAAGSYTLFPKINFPALSGTAALSGSPNGISAKTLKLSAGTATFTFGTPYSSAPVCSIGPSTVGNTYKVVVTTSSAAVISSSGTDTSTIGVICLPPVN